MRSSLVSLLFLSSSLQASVLDHEITTALNDAQKLPVDVAYQTRYFTLYSILEKERTEFAKLLNTSINYLSRKERFYHLRKVSPTVYAVTIDSLGWDVETWEKLNDIEPFFHARVKVLQGQKSPHTYYRGGSDYKAGWYQQVQLKEVTLTILAPWVDSNAGRQLSLAVNSAVPLVAANWFLFQSMDEAERKVGYYQWLGIKKLEDAQKISGLDIKLSQSALAEHAAIVRDSGVAKNNRQVFAFGTVLRRNYYQTRDSLKSIDKSNALRNLDKDFQFDAQEVYFPLPNGLYGFLLANAKGELQAVAPNEIAGDKSSHNNDLRVRVGVSCIRCHEEGLRPIEDWGRLVFRAANGIGLGSPNRQIAERLDQLYISPKFKQELDLDRVAYATALKELSGWTTKEYSAKFAEYWADIENGPVFPNDVERYLGIPKDQFVPKMRAYLEKYKISDLVLASTVADPPQSLRPEHFEEVIPIIMMDVMGAK